MAKQGGSHHTRRITLTSHAPTIGRKRIYWSLTSRPGPHAKNRSMPLGVLLRDVLPMGGDLREVKRILNAGMVKLDGKTARDVRRPVGLMDLLEIPKTGKAWRIQISSGRLQPKEIGAAQAKIKLCKVVGKRTVRGGKIAVSTHDGRTLLADNSIKVGSTLRLSMPDAKLAGMLPLAAGVRCLVMDGQHAGEIAQLEKIIERVGSMDSEAQLKVGSHPFVTVTKYLFVVDEEYGK